MSFDRKQTQPRREYEKQMLQITLSMIIAGCLAMLVYGVVSPPPSVWFFDLIIIGVIALQGIVYALMKRGFVHRAAQIDLIFLWGILFYGGYASGGIYASTVLLFFVLLIFSATMVSVRFTILMAILIILSFFGLYAIEVTGHLPEVPFKDLPYRMMILIGTTLVITMILAYHMQKMNESELQSVNISITAERLRVHQQLTHKY